MSHYQTLYAFLLLSTQVFSQTIPCRGEDTLVSFEAVGRPSLLKIHGKSEKPLKGSLKASEGKLTGSCVFELESFSTGIDLRDEHMKHKYLESEKYPNAEMNISSLKLGGHLTADKADFEGELLLHGQKKKVKGTANLSTKGEKVELKFHFELVTDDFGITQPSFKGITMAKNVKVDVGWLASPEK